ncbi:MAG: sulfatase [bacterium]|nr:sulfatase [bacterium]
MMFTVGVTVATPAGISDISPPNILLIVSEDNGPELGCYGDPYAKTPRLDNLAGEGIRFERAFVPQAGCSQSRASFLTGLYPHQHGQIGLATWGFRLYRADTPNLPRSLKSAGYRTGIIGKLHINPESAFPFHFHEIKSANFARNTLSDYARHADTFIRAGNEPFFLSVNYPDAHDPWLRQIDGLPVNPQAADDIKAMSYIGLDPPGMREMVADYYNCLSRLDALVGDLLDVLDRCGKADNTIVVYLGDHGADMLPGKRTCYEGGLRIPMLMRWPGKIVPQVRKELVSTIDLMPTLLAAAGVKPPSGLPGSELQPLFKPGEASWRTRYFAEYHTHAAAPNYFPQRSVRTERYKLIENLLPGEIHPDYDLTLSKLSKEAAKRKVSGGLNLTQAIAQAGSTVKHAYERMRQPPRFELYDLVEDPYEFHDLSGSTEHVAILHELQAALRAWREETNDPLLDPGNLERLSAEVRSIKSKDVGKDYRWGYPDYFFGREPAATDVPLKKRRKSKSSTQSED